MCGLRGHRLMSLSWQIYIDKFDTLDERIRDQMNEGIQDFTPGLEVCCLACRGENLVSPSPGCQVVAVRITKPRIPEIIRVNYERVEELKAQLLVVEQHAVRSHCERLLVYL